MFRYKKVPPNSPVNGSPMSVSFSTNTNEDSNSMMEIDDETIRIDEEERNQNSSFITEFDEKKENDRLGFNQEPVTEQPRKETKRKREEKLNVESTNENKSNDISYDNLFRKKRARESLDEETSKLEKEKDLMPRPRPWTG